MISIIIFYGSWLFIPLVIYCLWRFFKSREWRWGLLMIVCLIFIWARFVEPGILRVRNYNYNFNDKSLENTPSLRVLVLSDLHIGLFTNPRFLENIVERINVVQPDLVLIPGDFVYRIEDNQYQDFSALQKISVPIYAVLGNHDYGRPRGTDFSAKLIPALAENKVNLLENKTADLVINGKRVKIIGLSDYYNNDANLQLLDQARAGDLNLVLTHNPDLVEHFPTDKLIGLILAGHTHGGQIRIPGIYQKFIPTDYSFDRGWYNVKGYEVFVSSGLGMVLLPFRLLMPPELEVINFYF
jgi:uncharacterized protein